MSADPLRTLRQALESHGCQPHGPDHQFRARCPAHAGENPTALSVGVGADGRAVLWCHAHQCEPKQITEALGLQVADLFPDGHRLGRRYPLRPMRRSDFDGSAHTVANVLFALEALGEDWKLLLTSDCPYCGHPGAWLTATLDHVDADCPNGCGAHEYTQGLLGRLNDKEKTT